MKIYGLNKWTEKTYIVYHVVNKSKYFVARFRTEEKAINLCKKYGKNYFYIYQ